ncbi:hypothetical protein J7J83_03925 [bacterium]|nr:hypothetical protein [bacterium]
MTDSIIGRKYGGKVIRKKSTLSQEVRKTIVTLMFGLVLITVILSIVFLLNTSNSAQKGYVHSQLILQNEELENTNKALKMKVMNARSMINLENTNHIKNMLKPDKEIRIDN